jgi:hypothetical protein
MKWVVLAAAAMIVCTQAARASSCSDDYSISFSISPISGVGVQPALVTGDICTNGTTGPLDQSDIVSWNLTLSNSWNNQTPDFSLSSTNPNDSVQLDLLNASSPFDATANGLTWDFGDPGPGAYAILYFQDDSTSNYIALYDYDYGGEFTDYSYGNSQVANYGPTESGIVNLTLVPQTPVPEPASLVLLVSGIAGLGLMRRRQARTARG